MSNAVFSPFCPFSILAIRLFGNSPYSTFAYSAIRHYDFRRFVFRRIVIHLPTTDYPANIANFTGFNGFKSSKDQEAF